MSISLIVKRRAVQSAAVVLLTSNVVGYSLGGACLPILHCEACTLSWFGCPIGMMASTIAFHEIPWLVLGMVLGAAALVGRWFCGWICPSGLVQDLLFKIPSPKFTFPAWTRYIRYAVLVGPVILIAYYLGRDHFLSFCKWCPTATATVGIPQAVKCGTIEDGAELFRLGLLAVMLVLAVMSSRWFCKVLCPIGAMTSLGNRFSWLAVRMNTDKCGSCKRCDRECPMEVKVESRRATGERINRDPNCIECLKCEEVCTKEAITNNSRVLRRTPGENKK